MQRAKRRSTEGGVQVKEKKAKRDGVSSRTSKDQRKEKWEKKRWGWEVWETRVRGERTRDNGSSGRMEVKKGTGRRRAGGLRER